MNRKIILFNRIVNLIYLTGSIVILVLTQLYMLSSRRFLGFDLAACALFGSIYMSFLAFFYIILTVATLQMTRSAERDVNVRGYRFGLAILLAAEALAAFMMYNVLSVDYSPWIIVLVILMLFVTVLQLFVTYTGRLVGDDL